MALIRWILRFSGQKAFIRRDAIFAARERAASRAVHGRKRMSVMRNLEHVGVDSIECMLNTALDRRSA
jgi:hypothetical protein